MTKNIVVDGLITVVDVNGTEALLPRKVDTTLWNRAMTDIAKNNTWCPDITRIIYNVGEKKSKKNPKVTYPVLGCTVFFNDDTCVTVTNSENDPIELVEENGVKTASERSKEIALIYAITKKLIGKPTANGKVDGNGFGRVLRELVTGAWDQKIEEKRAKDQKTASKAKHDAQVKNAKPKHKRESLAKTVDRLAAAVEKLEAKSSTASAHKSWCKKPAKKSGERARNARGRFI